MNAALILTLYFAAQMSMLGILRKGTDADFRRYYTYNASLSQRTQADDLDLEILDSQSKSLVKSGIEIIRAEDGIKQLYYKKVKRINSQRNLATVKFLSACAYPPQNIRRLKEKITEALKTQYYCGSVPDYFNGGYCIRGDAYGALLLPHAVSSYINFSGDINFLREIFCYNQLSFKPLSKILPTAFCESVYSHVLKAIESFKLNNRGLIDITPQGLAPCEITDNIICSLLYCHSAECFLDFIHDCKTKIKYINHIDKIKNNALLICRQNTGADFEMLGYIAAGQNEKMYAVKNLSASAAVIIMYAMRMFKVGKFTSILNSLSDREISLAESLMLKRALLSGAMGISYKHGMLRAKPLCREFKIKISNKNNDIILEHSKAQKKGTVYIGGITFNNVDYINLKGYNKDIFITV